jgi:S1-C subfamily serine protease
VGVAIALILSIAVAAFVVTQFGPTGSVAATERAVVDINAQLDTGEAVAGTGMVIASNGTVLTNNHVVADAQNISVQLNGSGRTYSATVVGVDEAADVAVLSLADASGLPTIPLGDSSKVSSGDHVTTVGNALGRGGPPAVTSGQVTAINQTITATDQDGENPESLGGMIQFDGDIQPGDSGGPLVSQAGQVIGMDTAGSGQVRRISGNVGFAIPINSAVAIAHQITSGNKSGGIQIGSRGVMGVEVSDTFDDGGAEVDRVQPGSPARASGIRAGDVITTVNGASISSVSDLSNALDGKSPGDHVTVAWQDESGNQHSATVTLTSGPLS